jgi:hypothetical protein
VKELFGQIKPVYLIAAAVLVVVVLIGGGILIFSGGDDEPDAPDPRLGVGEGDVSQLPGSGRRQKEAPRVRTGVVDTARRVGRLAVAQARGTIVEPRRVRIRVSAAPKQTVTVTYQLGCYRNRRARVGKGSYRTRPPDTRGVRLPMSGAETCIVTAGAQLTKIKGEGRIKVSVIAGG